MLPQARDAPPQGRAGHKVESPPQQGRRGLNALAPEGWRKLVWCPPSSLLWMRSRTGRRSAMPSPKKGGEKMRNGQGLPMSILVARGIL